jgi:hypothetical protein
VRSVTLGSTVVLVSVSSLLGLHSTCAHRPSLLSLNSRLTFCHTGMNMRFQRTRKTKTTRRTRMVALATSIGRHTGTVMTYVSCGWSESVSKHSLTHHAFDSLSVLPMYRMSTRSPTARLTHTTTFPCFYCSALGKHRGALILTPPSNLAFARLFRPWLIVRGVLDFLTRP